VSFPTVAYRVWATYNPKKAPPCQFTMLASALYEKRERAVAYARGLVARRTDPQIEMSHAAWTEFVRDFGLTEYEIREEPVNGRAVVLGDDDDWTSPPA
jgi:hypothetical protein